MTLDGWRDGRKYRQRDKKTDRRINKTNIIIEIMKDRKGNASYYSISFILGGVRMCVYVYIILSFVMNLHTHTYIDIQVTLKAEKRSRKLCEITQVTRANP